MWFRNIARGKRAIALDLKDAAQKDIFLKLADDADVIVEAFRPGAAKRLGIDYDTIAARNPRIVYCSISAFGQDGPYRDKPAHDLAVQALAGTADLSRGNDDKPAMPNLVAADMASSLTALSAILMALLAREKTGKGDFIDIAMFDSLLAWTPNITGSVLGEDRAPVPKQMRNYGGQAMNRLYETKDGGHIALAGNETKFCENLFAALGRPDLASSRRASPARTQAPLIAFLTETFATKTRAEWEAFLAPDRSLLGAAAQSERRVRRSAHEGARDGFARRGREPAHRAGGEIPQTSPQSRILCHCRTTPVRRQPSIGDRGDTARHARSGLTPAATITRSDSPYPATGRRARAPSGAARRALGM